MKRIDLLDALEDIREIYQYLQTKVEVCKETLDNNEEKLNPFEKEKLLDLFNSIKEKHTEIYEYGSKISNLIAKS